MVANTHATNWELPLMAWAEWPASGEEAELPKLDFVDPMMRRRLSALSKISLWVAHQCAHALIDVRIVYASQHGEVVRTTEMLEALAADEPLSPTAFSMSVLNASVGLYSIMRGNTAPATAIAAGAETLGYALLEARGQLDSDPTRPVLVIYADETVPALLEPQESYAPHALALLIQNSADTRIRCSRAVGTEQTFSKGTQAQSFAACLKADASRWGHAHNQWQWQRLAA